MRKQIKYNFAQAIEMFTLVKPSEARVTFAAFAMVFILMASYFILRPVRDAMASDWSDAEVSMLWNLQFFISAGLISAYGLAISRLAFKRIVPFVYLLFAASFVGFYVLIPSLTDPTLVEKTFYVWVSTFSLFHVSLFWSLVSDTFTKEQGKRLFAIIAAGASAGAIIGPSIPVLFSNTLGLPSLMLLAAIGITAVVPLAIFINRYKTSQSTEHATLEKHLGGRWWQGFRDVFSDRFLFSIALFILLYVFISTFVYFEQKNLLAPFSRPERAQILGSIDWIVNTLTFVFAFFITNRMVNRLGMPTVLMLMPILLALGLLVLALAPAVIVILVIQVVRRVGNYAITRPAREMLFSRVTQEQRFKAKPVIDVVVYRGGDALSGTIFALFSEGLGLGLAALAAVGAAMSALWAWVGKKLGGHYESEVVAELNTPPQNNQLIKT